MSLKSNRFFDNLTQENNVRKSSKTLKFFCPDQHSQVLDEVELS